MIYVAAFGLSVAAAAWVGIAVLAAAAVRAGVRRLAGR